MLLCRDSGIEGVVALAKYEKLVEQIRDQIQNEIWKVGDKLPSLRKQTDISGMSLMTVLHAYQVLESQGWVVSHARSGYFVAPKVQYLSAKSSDVMFRCDGSDN